jgi:hypothetical protein
MKNFSFSATFLSNLSCARRADYAHNRHLTLKEDKPIYFQEGELGHLFMRYYYTSRKLAMTHSQSKDAAEEQTRLFYSSGLQLPVEDCERIILLCLENVEYWRNDGWNPVRVEEPFAIKLFEDKDYYVQSDSEDAEIEKKIEILRSTYTNGTDGLNNIIQSLYDSRKGLTLIIEGVIDLEVRSEDGKLDLVDHKFIGRNREPDELSYQFMLYSWAFNRTRIKINHIGKQKSLKPQDKFSRWIRSYDQFLLDETIADITSRVLRWLKDDSDGIYTPDYSSCNKFNTDCLYLRACKTAPKMREAIILNYYRTGEPYNPFKDRNKTGRAAWFD